MTTTAAPTGVLLGQFAPGTPEWEEVRSGLTITATEAPAVVGLSPWMSPFTLWHRKAGLPAAPFTPNPAMEWGIRLEDAVARKYADEHPELTVTETGTWRHRDRGWQRATPDRIADDRLLEVKTSPVGDEWGEPGTDEVPVGYRAQVTWQMDVLGYDRTDFAVLISGHDYREYTVRYDAAEAGILRAAAERFLEAVRLGERPDIDGSESTYRTVAAQKPGVECVSVDIGPRLADRYRDVLENAKALEVERRQVAALILDRLGPATRAEALGELIAIRATKADGSTHALMPARAGKKAN